MSQLGPSNLHMKYVDKAALDAGCYLKRLKAAVWKAVQDQAVASPTYVASSFVQERAK